jgi:hypothetical protein
MLLLQFLLLLRLSVWSPRILGFPTVLEFLLEIAPVLVELGLDTLVVTVEVLADVKTAAFTETIGVVGG